VFEGVDGWAIAIPNEPAHAGFAPQVWIFAEQIDDRTELDLNFSPVDNPATGGYLALSYPPGAEGQWFKTDPPPLVAGQYKVDLVASLTQRVLAQAMLEVE
jgi:hypothetical protein